jgi:hypothetical protein
MGIFFSMNCSLYAINSLQRLVSGRVQHSFSSSTCTIAYGVQVVQRNQVFGTYAITEA